MITVSNSGRNLQEINLFFNKIVLQIRQISYYSMHFKQYS